MLELRVAIVIKYDFSLYITNPVSLQKGWMTNDLDKYLPEEDLCTLDAAIFALIQGENT